MSHRSRGTDPEVGGVGRQPAQCGGSSRRHVLSSAYPSTSEAAKKDKPTHYKVVSISLYNEDIERLEAMVAELKRRGFTKANKSQLIRFALDSVDLDAMPRGY